MIISILKLAFRNILKNKLFNSINILGLAIGVTSSLLMLLYVFDELSYDAFHSKGARLYRLNGTSINPEGNFYRTRTPAPTGPVLMSENAEIEEVMRVASTSKRQFEVGGQKFYEDRFLITDANFFEILNFDLIDGSSSGLEKPGTIIINKRTAEKYFGNENPIGKSLRYEDQIDFEIVAVAKNPPQNTLFQFDIVASIHTKELGSPNWLTSWNNSTVETFLLLSENTLPEVIEQKLPLFVETHYRAALDDEESFVFKLQSLKDIHLYPHVAPENVWAASNLKYVQIFPILGLIILIIASINYMNLWTMGQVKRLKEIGVRKVLGSNHRQLVKQFFIESMAVTFLAFCCSMLLLVLVLPYFNSLSGKIIVYEQLLEVKFIMIAVLLYLITTLIAGAYPSFYLSSFKTSHALKGIKKSVKGINYRNGMVIVQFTLAVILIISTFTINSQLAFMQNRNLGFRAEQVINIPIRDRSLLNNIDPLRDALSQSSNILFTTFSSGIPGNIGFTGTSSYQLPEGEKKLEVYHIMTDYDFLKTYGVEISEGRDFSRDFPADETSSFIVNQSAVKAMGWSKPVGESLTLWGKTGEIIGVVEDFQFESFDKPIEPVVLHFDPRRYRLLSIKIKSGNFKKTLTELEQTWSQFSSRPFEYSFLDQSFGRLFESEKQFGKVIEYFTALAFILAGLGLLSLTGFMVEQKMKEIAMRKIMGSSFVGILWLLIEKQILFICIAFVIATPIAYFSIEQWLSKFAFRTNIGINIYVSVLFIIILFVILTVGFQTIKAAISRPVEMLRNE